MSGDSLIVQDAFCEKKPNFQNVHLVTPSSPPPFDRLFCDGPGCDQNVSTTTTTISSTSINHRLQSYDATTTTTTSKRHSAPEFASFDLTSGRDDNPKPNVIEFDSTRMNDSGNFTRNQSRYKFPAGEEEEVKGVAVMSTDASVGVTNESSTRNQSSSSPYHRAKAPSDFPDSLSSKLVESQSGIAESHSTLEMNAGVKSTQSPGGARVSRETELCGKEGLSRPVTLDVANPLGQRDSSGMDPLRRMDSSQPDSSGQMDSTSPDSRGSNPDKVVESSTRTDSLRETNSSNRSANPEADLATQNLRVETDSGMREKIDSTG